MSFQALRSAVDTKLRTLSGAGKPIAYVYDFHKLGVEGYPAATFEPAAVESRIETTDSNYRTYAFDVVIHQEMEELGRQGAISSLVNVCDAVIDAFDADYDLGWAADMVDAAPAEFGEIETEDSVIAYAKIMIRCNVLKKVTP